MGKTKNSGKTDNDKANSPDKSYSPAKANSLDKPGQSNSPDKVVSFSENRGRDSSLKEQRHSDPAQSTSTSPTTLPYDGVNSYKALLELQSQVMDELYQLTADMLNELHYQADKFVLNEDSAMDFLDANMYEFIAGIGDSLDLIFDAKIDGITYKTLASAFYMGDHIEMGGIICKYDEKGKRWLAYTGEGDEWDLPPEEVLFHLVDE